MTGSCGPYRSVDFGGRQTIFVDSDGNADVRTNQEHDANQEDYEFVDNRHWSRSLGLWMVAIYIVLFLIRPWEILSPWLASFRFERMYAISMICVVVVMGRMPRWNLQTGMCELHHRLGLAYLYSSPKRPRFRGTGQHGP